MNDDHEELEHIPWSELMASDESGNRRLLYLGAGVVAALAVGMLIGRSLLMPDGPEPITVVEDTMASSTVPATAPAVVETTVAPAPTTATTEAPPTSASTTTITTVAVSQPPVLYSEADLRVAPEDADVLAAASRAEWFVSDYFTADSEENTAAAVLDALPPGTELPPMPHEEGSGITYVEWARAFRIEPEGDGVYTVGVLFRSLVSPEGGAYYRIRMRAVEVTVAVGVDGGTTVLDLPAAVPVPDGPLAAPQRSDPIVPPGDVADRAVALALEWGSDPLVLGATLEEEGWRVVLTVADEIGSRWPVVVRVPVE